MFEVHWLEFFGFLIVWTAIIWGIGRRDGRDEGKRLTDGEKRREDHNDFLESTGQAKRYRK